jgi:hypothetical protein
MLMHVIEAEEIIRALSWSSRLNADWDTFSTWGVTEPTSGSKPILIDSASSRLLTSTLDIFDAIACVRQFGQELKSWRTTKFCTSGASLHNPVTKARKLALTTDRSASWAT